MASSELGSPIRYSLFATRFPTHLDNEQRNSTMTGPETLDVARDAIWTIVIVSSP